MIATVLSFLTLAAILVAGDNWDCADYYWRDYYGVIPDDAVPAGKYHNGDTTLYVGLAYIRGVGFLPGTIFPDQQLIRTLVDNTIYNTDQYVKILCSPHIEAFDWISIESKDLHTYINRNLIPGGNKVGENLYIGRVIYNNDTIVGKVFRHESNKGGMRFAAGDKAVSTLFSDILLFDCDKVSKVKMDVRSNVSSNKDPGRVY